MRSAWVGPRPALTAAVGTWFGTGFPDLSLRVRSHRWHFTSKTSTSPWRSTGASSQPRGSASSPQRTVRARGSSLASPWCLLTAFHFPRIAANSIKTGRRCRHGCRHQSDARRARRCDISGFCCPYRSDCPAIGRAGRSAEPEYHQGACSLRCVTCSTCDLSYPTRITGDDHLSRFWQCYAAELRLSY
jgi:hypothetical protein